MVNGTFCGELMGRILGKMNAVPITVDGMCMVCGDKSAGKHYGSPLTPNSLDQRNACRFCRFQRCLQVGMEPDAIRPDRDVIGKQKNPRKRKIKQEQQESSLPSPGTESNSSQQEDFLFGFLMEIEMKSLTNSNNSGNTEISAFFNPNGIEIGAKTAVTSTSSSASSSSINATNNASLMEDTTTASLTTIGISATPFHSTNPNPLKRFIKTDPEVSLAMIFENPSLVDDYRRVNCSTPTYSYNMMNESSSPLSTDEENGGVNPEINIGETNTTANKSGYNRNLATVDHVADAMRKYVILCIDWVNSLFYMANITSVNDKMIILKNSFAAFCTFQQATQTARYLTNNNISSMDSLCLCNGRIVPRNIARQYLDTNLLANNLVGRVLDELVFPLLKFNITEQERVALTALIILEGDCRNVNSFTSDALFALKEKIQNSLFQHIRDRVCESSISRASSRFANILLLLPSVAKVAAIYYENAQLTKMFGRYSLDPLLAEIFLDSSSKTSEFNTAAFSFANSGRMNVSNYSHFNKNNSIGINNRFDGFEMKPLTVNCAVVNSETSANIFNNENVKNDEAISTSSRLSSKSEFATSFQSSTAPSTTTTTPVKACFDVSTQTPDSPTKFSEPITPFVNAIDYSKSPPEQQQKQQQELNSAVNSNSVDYNSHNGAYSRDCRSYEYTRQHYGSGDSVGCSSRISGHNNFGSEMDESIFNNLSGLQEDTDTAQMNSIIKMGLDLADEHSRSSFNGVGNSVNLRESLNGNATTFENKIDDAVATTAVDPLFVKLFPQRHSSGNSSDSGISGVRTTTSEINALHYNASQQIDDNSIANNFSNESISPTQSAFNAVSRILTPNRIDASENGHNFQLPVPIASMDTKSVHMLRNNTLNGQPVSAETVEQPLSTTDSNKSLWNNSNFYLSYSQLHQQMAQQHGINLTNQLHTDYNDYDNTKTNNSNDTNIVQQFVPETREAESHLYNEQQQSSQNFHQQQLYQQFFNTEQILLQQQQQQQNPTILPTTSTTATGLVGTIPPATPISTNTPIGTNCQFSAFKF